MPQEAIDAFNTRTDEAIAAAKNLFETATSAAGRGDQSEWRVADGDLASALALQGRYADLIVVGQYDEERPYGVEADLADNVVMESGRPVLVVPYIRTNREPGRRVLVAWNASREAARAVADAMPVLRSAETVVVMATNPNNMGDEPGADIAHHLARHGVNVEASHTISDGLDIGDVLLNSITDLSADMLVMGAYGHSRFRETVLGGATRHVLKHMTVPTFMAH